MAVEGSCAIVSIALPQADETVVLDVGKRADEFLELPLEQPATRNAGATINAEHLASITLSITPTDAFRFLLVPKRAAHTCRCRSNARRIDLAGDGINAVAR